MHLTFKQFCCLFVVVQGWSTVLPTSLFALDSKFPTYVMSINDEGKNSQRIIAPGSGGFESRDITKIPFALPLPNDPHPFSDYKLPEGVEIKYWDIGTILRTYLTMDGIRLEVTMRIMKDKVVRTAQWDGFLEAALKDPIILSVYPGRDVTLTLSHSAEKK